MQVRLLESRAGFLFSQQPGDVIELPQDEALRLIAGGIAETFVPKPEGTDEMDQDEMKRRFEAAKQEQRNSVENAALQTATVRTQKSKSKPKPTAQEQK